LKGVIALTLIPLAATIQAYVHLRRGTGRDPRPRIRVVVTASTTLALIGYCVYLGMTGQV
jgi:hypothetical protein